MQEAQFVFVTEDARVMAMSMDGHLEDVTDRGDLLPHASRLRSTLQATLQDQMAERLEKQRILRHGFAA